MNWKCIGHIDNCQITLLHWNEYVNLAIGHCYCYFQCNPLWSRNYDRFGEQFMPLLMQNRLCCMSGYKRLNSPLPSKRYWKWSPFILILLKVSLSRIGTCLCSTTLPLLELLDDLTCYSLLSVPVLSSLVLSFSSLVGPCWRFILPSYNLI
jgi:hypothetical protein